jgi:hypothetical protein
LRANIATYSTQIQTARNNVQKFDSNNKALDTNQKIDNSDEYVDLADLASELQIIPDTTVHDAAQEVLDNVGAYVIANTANFATDVYAYPALNPYRIHGVSIFFPPGDFKRSFYSGLNLDFAAGAVWSLQANKTSSSSLDWGSFVVNYVENITPSAPDDPDPPDLISPLEPPKWLYFPLVMR